MGAILLTGSATSVGILAAFPGWRARVGFTLRMIPRLWRRPPRSSLLLWRFPSGKKSAFQELHSTFGTELSCNILGKWWHLFLYLHQRKFSFRCMWSTGALSSDNFDRTEMFQSPGHSSYHAQCLSWGHLSVYMTHILDVSHLGYKSVNSMETWDEVPFSAHPPCLCFPQCYTSFSTDLENTTESEQRHACSQMNSTQMKHK